MDLKLQNVINEIQLLKTLSVVQNKFPQAFTKKPF